MGTMAYPYRDDGLARTVSRAASRRQSLVGYGGQQQIAFPYSDQHPGMYNEPPMSAGLHEVRCMYAVSQHV